MTASAALTAATSSTETFGLPAEVPHLIAKLRNLGPEEVATIFTPKEPK